MNKRLAKKQEKRIEQESCKLFAKCVRNGLKFSSYPKIDGLIDVMESETSERISSGYLIDWKWETPAKVLERMHKEVDSYIEKNRP